MVWTICCNDSMLSAPRVVSHCHYAPRLSPAGVVAASARGTAAAINIQRQPLTAIQTTGLNLPVPDLYQCFYYGSSSGKSHDCFYLNSPQYAVIVF